MKPNLEFILVRSAKLCLISPKTEITRNSYRNINAISVYQGIMATVSTSVASPVPTLKISPLVFPFPIPPDGCIYHIIDIHEISGFFSVFKKILMPFPFLICVEKIGKNSYKGWEVIALLHIHSLISERYRGNTIISIIKLSSPSAYYSVLLNPVN